MAKTPFDFSTQQGVPILGQKPEPQSEIPMSDVPSSWIKKVLIKDVYFYCDEISLVPNGVIVPIAFTMDSERRVVKKYANLMAFSIPVMLFSCKPPTWWADREAGSYAE